MVDLKIVIPTTWTSDLGVAVDGGGVCKTAFSVCIVEFFWVKQEANLLLFTPQWRLKTHQIVLGWIFLTTRKAPLCPEFGCRVVDRYKAPRVLRNPSFLFRATEVFLRTQLLNVSNGRASNSN
jgi:hypothetical protein